nr:PhnD/SsuA/transferrin family substrate-binding protein [Methylomarinum sp. Ch1-1]MDP4520294.1 PhnD/SsuA/transferrin family substrate-binding protein [Methylomarinum sp. Ch1-1]
MSSMLRVVERIGQWQENGFNSRFTSQTDECRKLMTEYEPKFAITSLGLYLELRKRHNLLPLVQPRINGRTSERYRVLAKQGKYNSLDQMQGLSLGGTVLAEPAFIDKIVFAGQYDLAQHFHLKPSKLAIRTLRSLDKGELDAVILNEQQFSGLSALHLQSPLEVVFISADIPLMGVVANGSATTEEERARFSLALQHMCSDSEGQKLCELFGVESFNPVDDAVFEPLFKLWTEGG